MLRTAPTVALALAIPFLLGGCRESKVESYRVKKDPEPAAITAKAAPAAAPSMASTPVATAEGAGLSWTAPASWTSKAASSMRRGTFVIKGADGTEAELAITAFPGDVGGDLANVNRWRGQLSLPPIPAGELEAALSRFTANGLNFAVVDLSAGPQRILGAIVPHAQSTWFFKLTGPDALVTREKPAFLAFLQTVRAQ